jgi:drug/metabolite transporter (DMT)-like permease
MLFSPIRPASGSDTRISGLCESKERMENQASHHRRLTFLGYAACALAGTLWGTGFYFGRLALNEMSVEHMVLYRFLFACLGMLPVVVVNRNRLHLQRSEIRLLLCSAALGIPIQFLIQFHGLARTTVSHASLMVGAMPVLLAAAAALFAGERLDAIGWTALFGSTLGAALIVLGGSHDPATHGEPTLIGDLLVVASLCTALAWILLSKKQMQTHNPAVVTALTILPGTAMLAVWVMSPWLINLCLPSSWIPQIFRASLASAQPLPFAHVSLTAWLALAASGLLCTATTTLLWNWGIHHVPASRAGVFLNIEPALGSWLGVQLLGEHLGPYAWLGGGLILAAAVTLTTRSHQPDSGIVLE